MDILAKLKAIKINGGVILILAALAAIFLANSSYSADYFAFWQESVELKLGPINTLNFHGEKMSLLTFVNDVLMTIFFFSVGLEIKREVLVGELSSPKKALFPIIAACGGMIIPVLTFLLLSGGNDAIMRGAPISMATDIAFSLGVLSLFGSRVPVSLKIFLTTLAVADDIGGIVVIALFFSGHISVHYLLYALGVWLIMIFGGYFLNIRAKLYYVALGIAFWVLFMYTGIHPTIAGVLIAFTIPARPFDRVGVYIDKIHECIDHFPRRNIPDGKKIILSHDQLVVLKKIESASDRVISPLQDMEDSLHNLVNYIIMPIFAFANAGVVLGDISFSSVFSGITLAVMLSLICGKFVGIFSFSYLSDRFKLSDKPSDITWKHVAGVSLLGGVGFTVSLFIANLAFPHDVQLLNDAKLGIVIGSIVSGIMGYVVLSRMLPKEKK